MKVVGLTGGIGSGKTSVLQLFINKGVPVYIADIEAKRLMQTDATIKDNIQRVFGENSYRNNQLNRSYLAEIVFNNKEKLAQLNAIVHPVVHSDFLEFISRQNAPFIIYENAILFENGSDQWCDYIIVVTAPTPVRIARVIKRDLVSAEQVQSRIANQWDESYKIQHADFVIENIDWESTEKQVNQLYKKLQTLSK